MDWLTDLAQGLGVALSGLNGWYGFAGCLLGLGVGVLSGLGPLVLLALLMPVTHALAPVTALILLAGICGGAQYGAAARTVLLQGAEPARLAQNLVAVGVACFLSGCCVAVCLTFLVAPLSDWFSNCGPVGQFSLMVLTLVGVAVLSTGAWLKAVAMVVMGLLLGLAGTGNQSGTSYYGLVLPGWNEGLVFVALGVLSLGETIHQLGKGVAILPAAQPSVKPWETFAGLGSVRQGLGPWLWAWWRGGGFRQGWGTVALLPLLVLGFPINALMALLLGSLDLHNLETGPSLLANHAVLVWGLLASLWLGQGILALFYLPLIGLCSRLLLIPARWLVPVFLLSCALGVFAVSDRVWDVWLLGLFGLVGYVFRKLGLPATPLLLGWILGPMMEDKLHSSLQLSHGHVSVLLTEPVSAVLLALAASLLLLASLPRTKLGRMILGRQDFS